ncbi:tetratricopeptide repeat protein [Aquibaculum sediminis]|uniref:tetratricopeptide repeat protein n=1 Tax=Aquibaculum sediminis TaxID=3231907 RepID=UPI003451D5FB
MSANALPPRPFGKPLRRTGTLSGLAALLLLGACATTEPPAEPVAESTEARLQRVMERARQAAAPAPAYYDTERPAPGVNDDKAVTPRDLVQARRLTEALAAYNAILRDNPKDIRALDGRGVVLDLLDLGEEARKSYYAALEQDPDDLSALNNLGLSLALDGQHRNAIEFLRAAASHPRAGPRHRQNLALAYGLAGHEEEAAAIGRLDLDDSAVQQNLDFYAATRRARVRGEPGVEIR